MDTQPSTPSTRSSKLVGALVGAVAALSIGGVGMAFAQDAVETPTTEAPAAETPAAPADREDCPEKDDAGGTDGSSATDAAGEV
jgi:hypothetical protein